MAQKSSKALNMSQPTSEIELLQQQFHRERQARKGAELRTEEERQVRKDADKAKEEAELRTERRTHA